MSKPLSVPTMSRAALGSGCVVLIPTFCAEMFWLANRSAAAIASGIISFLIVLVEKCETFGGSI